MDISVIGAGRVGLLTAVCLAEKGHSVVCLDSDTSKVEPLSEGHVSFSEPFLADLLQGALASGQLQFTTDWAIAMREPEVVFIAVGTPAGSDGSADLSQVEAVCAEIGRKLMSSIYIVERSTVPVGTCELVRRTITAHSSTYHSFSVVCNPEFMREGSAVRDFLSPERVVIGVESEAAAQTMRQLYHWVESPFVITSVRSAELIKHAANAFLALKLSYINSIAQLCELCGADIKEVSQGLATDSRIGPAFLGAGLGYGGPCLPKDIRAFIKAAELFGHDLKMLKVAEETNLAQRKHVIEKIASAVGVLAGKKIAVYGLTFKPGTDELRESPAVDVVRKLQAAGAQVVAYDPAIRMPTAELKGIKIASDPFQAALDSDAQVFLTNWPDFKVLDFTRIREVAREAQVIDARNMFDSEIMRQIGIPYIGIGITS